MRKLDWADAERVEEVARQEGVVRVSRPSRRRPEDVGAIADSSDLTGYVLTVGDDVHEAWSLAEESCAAREGHQFHWRTSFGHGPGESDQPLRSRAVLCGRPRGSVLITSGPVDVDASRLADLVVVPRLHDR